MNYGTAAPTSNNGSFTDDANTNQGQFFLDPNMSAAKIRSLYKKMDLNKNGLLSLEELDRALKVIAPTIYDKKEALMGAYRFADRSKDGQIDVSEFAEFMYYLNYFNQLYEKFSKAAGNDGKIDFKEFQRALYIFDLDVQSDKPLQEILRAIDRDGSGTITFNELCDYMARSKSVKEGFVRNNPNTLACPTKSSKQGTIDAKLLSSIRENKLSNEQVHYLFEHTDIDRSGFLSLAEVKQIVVEIWPNLSKQPRAIEQAFKSADKDGNNIDEIEFAGLMHFLSYFDNMLHTFADIDTSDDNFVSFDEFRKGYSVLGLPEDLHSLQDEFDKLNTHGTGLVRFEDFCLYMSKKYSQERQSSFSRFKTKLTAFFGFSKKTTEPDIEEVAVSQQPVLNRAPVVRHDSTIDSKQPSSYSSPYDGERQRRKFTNTSHQYELPTLTTKLTEAEAREIFQRFDCTNQNGLLSLAEIDKSIKVIWPEMYKHRAAFIRAYKAADKSKNGFIEEKEFGTLLRFLAYYDLLYEQFDRIDTNDDKRISLEEFKLGHKLAGIAVSDREVEKEYRIIDSNCGGIILFDEYCMYMAKKYAPKELGTDLAQIASNNGSTFTGDNSKQKSPGIFKSTQQMPGTAKASGKQNDTHGKFAVPKLNTKMSKTQLHELFQRFDSANQNGLLSLAEIDKSIRDLWPDMYKHRSAFIRAYRAADKSKDGLIEEKEFGILLLFLAYYDLLYGQFDQIDSDDDKRISLDEFKKGHKVAGIDASDRELEKEFRLMDKNCGGIILFDEYCMYMAKKYAPKELSANMVQLVSENSSSSTSERQRYPSQTSPESRQSNFKSRFGKELALANSQNAGSAKALAPINDPRARQHSTSSQQSVGTTKGGLKHTNVQEPSEIATSPLTVRGETALRHELQAAERRFQHEQFERRKNESVIEVLRAQIEEMGGSVDEKKVQRQKSQFDTIAHLNVQLQEKLSQERERSFNLEQQLKKLQDELSDRDADQKRKHAEEQKSTRSNQIHSLQQEIRDMKIERGRFEQLYEELGKKLAIEQEKAKKLSDEILQLRARNHITEFDRPRKNY